MGQISQAQNAILKIAFLNGGLFSQDMLFLETVENTFLTDSFENLPAVFDWGFELGLDLVMKLQLASASRLHVGLRFEFQIGMGWIKA